MWAICNSKSFVRFIPGSAIDVHYQAYLLEGLSRWNQAQALAAAQQQDSRLWTFNLQLAHKVGQQYLISIMHDL